MKPNELFRRGLSALGLNLDQPAIDHLCLYLRELQKWNRRINLIGKAEDDAVIETHFLDSLTLLPLVPDCPAPGLVDVGSGAGFPGLVLKIARPELPVVLLEPRQKRTSFLRHVIRSLDLQGIHVLESRLEPSNPDLAAWLGGVPVMTSRAFASVSVFLDLAAPFCSPGGRVICMKGPRAGEEVSRWRQERPDSPFDLVEEIETDLPFSGNPRKLLVFRKERG